MIKVLDAEDVDHDGGGGPKLNERRLKTFVSSLVNTESLRLNWNAQGIIYLVLAYRFAESNLRSLKELKLETPYEWKKPFDSKVYRQLEEYPLLSRLEISNVRYQEFSCGSKGGRKLTKISRLVLKGDLVYKPSTISFIENFPNLTSLTLNTSAYNEPNYGDLVSILPKTLTSLSLLCHDPYDNANIPPCDERIPHLINLEYLYLGQGVFSQTLIDPLRQVPNLRTLGFGPRAILEPSKLEELIVGPNRLLSLEKVIFDQFVAKRGWSVEKDSDKFTLHPGHVLNPNHVGPGWEAHASGTALSDFDYDLKPLIKKIRGASIQIEGTTLEAIEVWDDFKVEVMCCELAYALQIRSLDDLRTRKGAEYVEEFKDIVSWDIYEKFGMDEYKLYLLDETWTPPQ